MSYLDMLPWRVLHARCQWLLENERCREDGRYEVPVGDVVAIVCKRHYRAWARRKVNRSWMRQRLAERIDDVKSVADDEVDRRSDG